MHSEAQAITYILKYLWVGIVVPAFIFLFKRQEKIKEESVTAVQMISTIESKLSPIYSELKQSRSIREENTKEMKALSELITQLRIDLASRLGKH